jgi:hypothetical protein
VDYLQTFVAEGFDVGLKYLPILFQKQVNGDGTITLPPPDIT